MRDDFPTADDPAALVTVAGVLGVGLVAGLLVLAGQRSHVPGFVGGVVYTALVWSVSDRATDR
jgi:hypothetical protein